MNPTFRTNRYLEKMEQANNASEAGERELEDSLLDDMGSIWHDMSQAERDYVNAQLARSAKKDRSTQLALVAVVLICLGFIFWPREGKTEPCIEGLPNPPLVVIRADGTEIPVSHVKYELSGRVLRLTETQRIFCSGVE